MKFSININQKLAQKFGLSLKEACLLDFIVSLPSWGEEVYIDGKVWYFCSRNKVVEELPLVFTHPDRVYRLLKHLSEIGIIKYRKYQRKDLVRFDKKAVFFVKDNSNCKLVKNPENESNSSKIPSKLVKNPEKIDSRLDVENTSAHVSNSSKIPTNNNNNYNRLNHLFDAEAEISENPLVFEGIFKSAQFLENIKIKLRSEKLKFTDKQILEILEKWYTTNKLAMNLSKPLGILRASCLSYVAKVISTGGLKTNEPAVQMDYRQTNTGKLL